MNELSSNTQELSHVTINDMEDNLRQRVCHLVNISILAQSLRENLGNDCFGEQIDGLSQVVDGWHERCNIHYAIKTLVDNIACNMPEDVEDQTLGLCEVIDLALEKARREYNTYTQQ